MLLDDKHQRLLTRPVDELVFMIQALRHIIKMEQDEHAACRKGFQEFKLILKTLSPAVYNEVADRLIDEDCIRLYEYLSLTDLDRLAEYMKSLSNPRAKV